MWQRPRSSLEARQRRLQQGSIQNMQSTREHNTVVPIAVETLGPNNSEGLAFLTELGRRLSNASGDTPIMCLSGDTRDSSRVFPSQCNVTTLLHSRAPCRVYSLPSVTRKQPGDAKDATAKH